MWKLLLASMDSEAIKNALKEAWEKKFEFEYNHTHYDDSIFVDLYEQMVVDAMMKLTEPRNPIEYTTTTT